MPDGRVGVAQASTPTHYVDNEEVGTYLGMPVERQRVVAVGNAIVKVPFNEIQATYPSTTTEVFTYKNGEVTVATVTVTYTDATKEVLTSVVVS
jgi:hypothetical protein